MDFLVRLGVEIKVGLKVEVKYGPEVKGIILKITLWVEAGLEVHRSF